MELPESQDLAQRIARGPIPLGEALPIAKRLVETLSAAHREGIVHRDLRPSNIYVTADGAVTIADLGVAESVQPQTASVAKAVAYLSPEQAKGGGADARSDIWALGCVIFEMLTGTRAFKAESVPDTLALIITREPVWGLLPTNAPIRRLLHRCLQKDRGRRLANLADARVELDAAERELAGEADRSRGSWWRQWIS